MNTFLSEKYVCILQFVNVKSGMFATRVSLFKILLNIQYNQYGIRDRQKLFLLWLY